LRYFTLGKTGIVVSQICFGTLTISPLQRNMSLRDGLNVLDEAIDSGINFIDTADIYDTYHFIKAVLKRNKDLVIATKSYAYDKMTAQSTLERVLREIGRDYVDIFLLHEQESPLTLKGHEEALNFFIKQKENGYIRSVGISTHFVKAVHAASDMKEIDVIHPILNLRGIGIVDGTREDMEHAVASAYMNGKGIYIMKALGGGHLLKEIEAAYNYILNFPFMHSVAIGMQRVEEVAANVSYFTTGKVPDILYNKLNNYKRELIIQDWCQGCGSCTLRCRQGALDVIKGKAAVDSSKCILCGYCASACKELAIKVI